MFDGMNTSELLDALRSAYFQALQKDREKARVIAETGVKAAVHGHRPVLEGAINRLFNLVNDGR